MLDIIEKEIEFDETLKIRIELICKLAHVKPIFHNGSMKKINHSNLVYVESHRIEVKDKVILAVNYSNEVYINNIHNKLKIVELEDYYEHVSLDKNRDLAVEIIIELGDKSFWDTKDDNYKKRMK